MKFCKFSLFLALCVAACLPVVAQTEMRTDIPFDFIVAGKTLPAGHYKVAPAFGTDRPTWRIYNDHNSAMVLTEPVDSNQKAHRPSLVFLQADGVYALLQVWQTEHQGRAVPVSNVKQTMVAQGSKYVEIGTE
jgi:hypothetical protein